jgi:predicted metal-binding membrane protein
MRHLAGPDVWVDRVGGAAFVLIGLYQFTPWKAACLRACRASPDQRSSTYAPPVTALTTGIADGLSCVGACGALMSVLLVIGVMNVRWMVVLAMVMVLERHGRMASVTAGVVGASALAVGLAILADPALLNSIGAVAHHATMTS